jgi:hypothetical protein
MHLHVLIVLKFCVVLSVCDMHDMLQRRQCRQLWFPVQKERGRGWQDVAWSCIDVQ